MSEQIECNGILRKGNEMTEARKYPTRLVVAVGTNGHGTIRARKRVPIGSTGAMMSGKNGPYIFGYIFWSGAASDFYTVEMRDTDPFAVGKDDSAFYIAGTATTFDAAVRLASDVLAERLEVV